MDRRTVAAVVGALVFALTLGGLGAVGASTGTKPASGEPIKIGDLELLTGNFAEPTALQATQAYIDDWNARGGYKGQPIELVVEEPGFQPDANITAVQELAAAGVVGFTNIGLCQATLPIIQSLDVPILAPTNDDCEATALSPCVGKFGVDQGSKGVAFVTPDFPMVEQLGDPLEKYLEGQNVPFAKATTPIIATGADYDLVIADLKEKNIDTVWTLATPESAVLALESARRQGFGPDDGITWILGPPLYDGAIAEESTALDGIYVQLLTYPWETKNAATKKALKVIEGNVDDLDGFAASGYQAGAQLEALFKTFKGKEVTRESVAAAIKKAKPFSLPLSPVKVDLSGDPVDAPLACTLVQIQDKKFVPASDFIVVPATEYR